jgi:hypothetical protein
MGGWPIFDGQKWENATANTKGSYTQLIASTGGDAVAIWVNFYTMTQNRDILVDLAIGAASSEQVLFENLYCANQSPYSYFFPVQIPAGTRIAARSQSGSSGGALLRMQIHLLYGSAKTGAPAGKVHTLGANTADSGGVLVTLGLNDTKGSYAQITASTPADFRAIVLALGIAGNTLFDGRFFLLDLAVGGAGSEQIILPDLAFRADSTENFSPCVTPLLPIDIPAGTRLAVRGANDDATVDHPDVIIYGVS